MKNYNLGKGWAQGTLGKTEGKRREGQQRARQLGGITDYGHELEQTPVERAGQGGAVCCGLRRATVYGVRKSWAGLTD